MKTFSKDLLTSEQLKSAIKINVAIQTKNTKNIYSPDGFLNWVIPIDEFDRVVRDFGGSYSPCHYKNNYRKDEEAIEGSVNSIMLDFDDGMTLDNAMEVFKDYEGVIATTKSHQKDKNGLVCDRFRVILPTQTPIKLSNSEYKQLMEEIMKAYPEADKSCKNISRFYFASLDSNTTRLQGDKLFNWKAFWDVVKLRENAKKIQQAPAPQREIVYKFDGEKVDYLRSIQYTNKMLEVVKFHEKFGKGGRNNYLFSVANYLKDSGMSDDEVVSNVLWINAQGDGLGESEINKTIFRSMRLAV